MKIVVFGTGNMGSALANALKRTNHKIFLRGSKDGSKSCRDLCESIDLPEAGIADLYDSDIIFFVMPSNSLELATKAIHGYTGIIISVVGFDNYLIGESESSCSAAETIAKLVPSAKIVHGFTWMSSGAVAHPSSKAATSVVHCSDDREALLKVCNLTEEMGFHPIRAGRLINARYAEASGFLWGAIAIEEGYGWNTFFEVHPDNE